MTDGTERNDDRIRTFLSQCLRHPAPLDLEDRVISRLRRRRLWLAPFITGTVAIVAVTALAVVAFAAHTPPNATLPPGPATTSSPAISESPSPAETPTPPATATPVPATQVPAPTSHIVLSGAATGELTDIRPTCGLHDIVNNGHNFDSPYVLAVGVLNGHSVQVAVFDPSSFGAWEAAAHVIVTEFTTLSTSILNDSYSGWIVQSPAGISGFNLSAGVSFAVTVQPNLQYSSAARPKRPLTVTGSIVC
jgi:hypothetical protein